MIELNQVTTSQGPFPVLSRFTLSVAEGQFISLYGPTGCGKTTVLRVISGTVTPASGTVFVAGHDMTALSASERRSLRRYIGVCSLELLPDGREKILPSLMLPATLIGHSRKDAERMASEALDLCGLLPFAENSFEELSQGERRLAALAQALVHKPAVVLADDPVASLDPKRSAAVLDLLSEYASNGACILAVSHEPLTGGAAASVAMENLQHV